MSRPHPSACGTPLEGVRTTISPADRPPSSVHNVTIGFSTTDKIMSAAIRWITRSPCSHAWLAFNDRVLGLRLVMQAEAWGFEVRPWLRWQTENKLVAEFRPTGPTLDPSLKWIATYLGSRYDYRAAFLVGLWRWLGRGLRGKFNDPTKLMCSEGVIRFLQHAGYAAVADFDPETTSPARLMRRCFQFAGEFELLSAAPKIVSRFGRTA